MLANGATMINLLISSFTKNSVHLRTERVRKTTILAEFANLVSADRLVIIVIAPLAA